MEKQEIFTLSREAATEYSASIVRIGELIPIEGSDFLTRTVVDGFDIVVRKDEVHEGDVMVYCRIETVLDKSFLSANNLFELHERALNKNYQEIESLLQEGKESEAKGKVGFFNKHGRVKMVKLRGCPSMGFLFSKDALVRWDSRFKNINLEDYIDVPYWDSIFGKVFIKVYVPYTPAQGTPRNKDKREKKLKKFDKLIPGQFNLHYNTENINKEIVKFSPGDEVTVSVKIHGTSICIGNVLTKIPTQFRGNQELFNKIRKRNLGLEIKKLKRTRNYRAQKISAQKIQILKSKIKESYHIDYGVIYSSRNVIKNKYINKNSGPGFYKTDIWAEYYELLRSFIPQGYELFGEIFGYETGSQRMIQKNYDYGCEPGKNKLMIYRITVQEETGKRDLDVTEVREFSEKLVADHPELKDHIHHIDILYTGTLGDLYPDLDIENHWHENILTRMKEDKENFGMELREPLCKIKVPREGVVIRKNNDPISEAWKLKCIKFLEKERDNMDSGIIDTEMMENYG